MVNSIKCFSKILKQSNYVKFSFVHILFLNPNREFDKTLCLTIYLVNLVHISLSKISESIGNTEIGL